VWFSLKIVGILEDSCELKVSQVMGLVPTEHFI